MGEVDADHIGAASYTLNVDAVIMGLAVQTCCTRSKSRTALNLTCSSLQGPGQGV